MEREHSYQSAGAAYEADGWGEEEQDQSYPSVVKSHSSQSSQAQSQQQEEVDKNGFIVQKLENIEKVQWNLVNDARETLGVNDDQAITLLRYFKWNLEKLQESWFADDQQKLMKKIGLVFDPIITKSYPYVNSTLKANNQGYCQICYSKFNTTDAKPDALQCGHEFCSQDWRDYLGSRVNAGFI